MKERKFNDSKYLNLVKYFWQNIDNMWSFIKRYLLNEWLLEDSWKSYALIPFYFGRIIICFLIVDVEYFCWMMLYNWQYYVISQTMLLIIFKFFNPFVHIFFSFQITFCEQVSKNLLSQISIFGSTF